MGALLFLTLTLVAAGITMDADEETEDFGDEPVDAFKDEMPRFGAAPEGDLISGTRGDDDLEGSHQGDSISGQGGHDLIEGEGGQDTLAGGDGADILFGGTGADLILGGDGGDILAGEEGRDSIEGGDGDDVLLGGSFSQRFDHESLLSGGMTGNGVQPDRADGADTLDGGAGDDAISFAHGDLVRGGSGDDRFVATLAAVPGDAATIQDYTPGEDTIQLVLDTAAEEAAYRVEEDPITGHALVINDSGVVVVVQNAGGVLQLEDLEFSVSPL